MWVINYDFFIVLGALIGYTTFGDNFSAYLEEFECSITGESCGDVLASTILVIMVRGLFTQLKFLYAG